MSDQLPMISRLYVPDRHRGRRRAAWGLGGLALALGAAALLGRRLVADPSLPHRSTRA